MPTVTFYLVHRNGVYLDENGNETGRRVPSDNWHDWIGYQEIAAHRAKLFNGEYHEFQVRIGRIPSKSSLASKDHIPKEGDIAFSSGWDISTNPHSEWTVGRMRWNSDWWRANADAFESHAHGMAEEMEDRGEQIYRG